jgi:hypothetical protein
MISSLVWSNGKPASRAGMIAALGALGADYDRQVVIVQPQASKRSVAKALKNPKSLEAARSRQLDTLLAGAAGACRNVGASFIVVADGR